MKIIERIIEQPGVPGNVNDLWIQTSTPESVLRHFRNGRWVPISGSGGGGSDPNAVKFTPQDLSADQKSQARSNIGLGAVAYMGNIVGTI